MTTTTAVTLNGVTKRYGNVQAVAGVDLTIRSGEVVALLGPNGAGKSTTIEMLLGLVRPDGGSVAVYGSDPVSAIAAGRVGAMLQSGGIIEDAKVGELVSLVANLHRDPLPIGEALERQRPFGPRLQGVVRRAEATGPVRDGDRRQARPDRAR